MTNTWQWAQDYRPFGTNLRRAAWPADRYVVQVSLGVWRDQIGQNYNPSRADKSTSDWGLA